MQAEQNTPPKTKTLYIRGVDEELYAKLIEEKARVEKKRKRPVSMNEVVLKLLRRA